MIKTLRCCYRSFTILLSYRRVILESFTHCSRCDSVYTHTEADWTSVRAASPLHSFVFFAMFSFSSSIWSFSCCLLNCALFAIIARRIVQILRLRCLAFYSYWNSRLLLILTCWTSDYSERHGGCGCLVAQFGERSFDYFGLALPVSALRVFFYQAVETVLYLNLSAAFDLKTNLVPLATELFPELENFALLLGGPLIAAHVRIDHIDPAFATLARFTVTAWPNCPIEFLCDARPLLRLIQIAGHALSCDFLSYRL